MKFRLKPLSAVALATLTALGGCSSDDGETTKTAVFNEDSQTGLWCKAPDIVQVVDSDFYPLTQAEKDALRAAADPDGEWDQATIDDWNDPSSFAAYDYRYDGINLYTVFASVAAEQGYTNNLGLTNEEIDRQTTAKAEARTFKAETQKQAAVFGDGFDAWFDAWFATVPLTDYLGDSQRLQKARRGLELSLSTANDTEEVCYTPPASCPNFQVVDESGEFTCITPLQNPLAEDQPNGGVTETTVAAGYARVYFKALNHVDGETAGANLDVYKDIIIHAWNDPSCTAYEEESTTGWSQGPAGNGIDPYYGMYWDLNLLDAHDKCGNIIVYNKVDGDQGKKISSADLKLPLGNEGSAFANLDKQSYFQEGVNALNYDGDLYANQHPLVGASSGAKACGWGTELNADGDACLGQAISNCPEGTVAVGVGQEDVASKCVTVFDPAEATLYVRGGYHTSGWEANESNLMTYDGAGKFYLNYSYSAHPEGASLNDDDTVSHGFKVADENWTEETNFGAIKGGDMPSVDGAPVGLTVGEGVAQNLTASFAEGKIYQFVFDATNPESTTIKLNDVPITALPKITIGDMTYAMEYAGAGLYSATGVALEVGTYTISIADEGSEFAVGADDDTVLVNNTAKPMIDNGAAMSYEVTSAGEFDFVLNYSDMDAPTLLAQRGVPYGTEKLYIRGTMTGWGDPAPDADELVYDRDSRTYSVIYGLEAVSGTDAHQFKFASKAWGGALDLNGDQFTYSTDEDALALSGTGNISVKPDTSTAYQFSISFASGDVGVVKVEEAPIYIRGGIYGDGSWAADETMRLNFEPSNAGNVTEAGHVYSSVVTTTGPGFFKVADMDWGGSYGFNYGVTAEQETAGENAIVLGTPLQLWNSGDSKNISFQFPAGTYRFSFDDVSKQITVTEVE